MEIILMTLTTKVIMMIEGEKCESYTSFIPPFKFFLDLTLISEKNNI